MADLCDDIDILYKAFDAARKTLGDVNGNEIHKNGMPE
jgi:hypothetical protein